MAAREGPTHASRRPGLADRYRGLERRVAHALSHGLRARLLRELAEPATPQQLAERVGEPLATVAYHVHVLHELDCIERIDTRYGRGGPTSTYRARLRAHLVVEPLQPEENRQA